MVEILGGYRYNGTKYPVGHIFQDGDIPTEEEDRLVGMGVAGRITNETEETDKTKRAKDAKSKAN